MDKRDVSSDSKGKEPWYGNTVWPGVAALVALSVGFLNWTAQQETRRVAENALSLSKDALREQQRPFLEALDVKRNAVRGLEFKLKNSGKTTAYSVVVKFSNGIGSLVAMKDALTYQERTALKEVGILQMGWIPISQEHPTGTPALNRESSAAFPSILISVQPKSSTDLVIRHQARVSYSDTHKHEYHLKWCFLESLLPGSQTWLPCPEADANSSN